MAAFVQIIEYRTSKPDEVAALTEEFRKAREAAGEGEAPVRATTGQDRDDPGHYLSIVEFASYEAAMENSNRADTTEFAQKMMALCDGEPTFHNLDVTQSMEYTR
ncbi:antibiotic biosynthesis monooxygenase [Kribbella sp. VKM Ac-2568]|uniref:antibiotic biosynthesis monooxygenase n=1 Tax=Kribbella sp. VKM Ac-2568 TaxID=2512219 RepID=UPI0010536C68|nr:antibiotic biosynthesis monooxygenase [Kribbella sp. VKM Ac-2568]TCM39581.1 antibiotic biosynthesis monooxygenase [Kribbella sp. VKM Ac-2568]